MTAAPLIVAALVLVAECLRAARDAQSISQATPGLRPDRLSARGGWFDIHTSWRRKYRSWPTDQRPAWPGALTWSVAFSDFYHAAQLLYGACYAAAVLVAGTHPAPWWWYALALLPGRFLFEPTFRWLR